MTQYIPTLKPCNTTPISSCEHATKVHEAVFFLAAYLVALATGGYKPCLESFGADQFDDDDTKERKQKMSFFNWWNVSLCSGLFIGVTLIVYVQDYVSWGIAFLILAIIMGVTVFIFVIGRPFYRYRKPHGSPLTPLLQVMVAAMAKRKLACPVDSTLLYEVGNSDMVQGRLLSHTNRLRYVQLLFVHLYLGKVFNRVVILVRNHLSVKRLQIRNLYSHNMYEMGYLTHV